MKKITLPLLVFFILFKITYGQQLENGKRVSTSNSQNETINATFTNVITTTQSTFTNTEENEGIIAISIVNNNDTTNINLSSDPSNNDSNEFITLSNNSLGYNYSDTSVELNLSSDISSVLTTNVSYTTIQRVWKVVTNEEDATPVSIKIPKDSIVNNSEPGNYYMFISGEDGFNTTVDYKSLKLDNNDNFEAEYSFNGTSYITFGFAPKVTVERSINFNGIEDYIEMEDVLDLNPNGFTISAWINCDNSNEGNVSILSKRDSEFSLGYDLTLTDTNKINWKNNSEQSLTSITSIPDNEWHQIAVTYDGSEVKIYIDGVLDSYATRTAPIDTNSSFLIAAAGNDAVTQLFKGNIDEVRIWDTDLAENQLRFIMNQEIANNSGQVMGKEIPTSVNKNEINTIPWASLAGYFPMSVFTYKNVVDLSGNGNDGQLKNLMTVDKETAPLPYTSIQNGEWNNNTTWSNGNMQSIPGSTSIVDSYITIDWNIIRTSHTLTMNNLSLPSIKGNNRTVLGLYVAASKITLTGQTLTNSGNGLTITHYLNLAGEIDLDGESQLIQTLGSDLDISPFGKIERDQQGTADKYTYNYWSSPVTKENSTENSFKISEVMQDGSMSTNPMAINFSSSDYDGAPTFPIQIADYWIWKYAKHMSQPYSTWQHIRQTGEIFPGEGFTMKGPGTGTINIQQNYVFKGRPNNGNINLTLAPNNDYLTGNPYPSAIDANLFIRDNGPSIINENSSNALPLITGTLYFWKHWGGGSHILQEYQGGYATYNLSGSVGAASKGNIILDFDVDGIQTKKPGRYIPVGQGFFIAGKDGGTINFNNGQRVFKKEDDSSIFMRSANNSISSSTSENEEQDNRMKFRIGFNSVNTIHRQLLLTIDDNATPDVDWAYDGKLNESQIDDMFWVINDEAYIIQGSDEVEVYTVFPIGIKTDTGGNNIITIDALENISNDINIYLHDKALELYHNLRQSDYEIFLNAGEYLDRFEITFGTEADLLGFEDNVKNNIDIVYSNDIKKIVLINPNQIQVKSIALYNILGQLVHTIKDIKKTSHSKYDVKNLSTGAYFLKLYTATNAVLTKKVIVE